MIQNAIDVKRWVNILGRGSWQIVAINEKSQNAMKELFSTLDQINPTGDDDRKELWFRIRRPTIDEYVEENQNDDPMEDAIPIKTLKSWYEEEYPDDVVWFPFCSLHHNNGDEEFYGTFLDNNYILGIGDPNAKGYPIDVTELIGWLKLQVLDVIDRVRAGTYNDEISSSLPVRYRTGSVARRDYWDLNPDLRADFRRSLTQAEIDEFTTTCTETPKPGNLISAMTSRIFYESCAMCYDSVHYDRQRPLFFNESDEERARYGGGLTPKEKYYTYADGRDDNLKAVPMDDPEAFLDWHNEKGVYEMNGHHPWEIRTSGSISHSIHLIPYKDKKTGGWFFTLTGNAPSSSTEIVKYYLALRHANIPVELYDAKRIAARYLETDRIGIFPYNVFSMGRVDVGYYFNDKNIIDGINLRSDEHGDEVARLATWVPEKMITLK